MLKSTQGQYEDGEVESRHFRRSRDRAVVAIRKANREDMFKRTRIERQLAYQESTESEKANHKDDGQESIAILEAELLPYLRKFNTMEISEGDLSIYVDELDNQNFQTMLESLICIRRLLTFKNSPTMAAIELGVHGQLIELSSHESAQVRLEAWWSLANLAVGSNGECGHLVKKGVIPCFLRSLKEKDPKLIEQGVWGIGNLCADSVAFRDSILLEGGMPLLLQVVRNIGNPRLLKVVIWAVVNLCRGKPHPQYKLIEQGILFLCNLVISRSLTDQQELSDVLFVISHNCSGDKLSSSDVKTLFDMQFLPSVIELANHYDKSVGMGALRVLQELMEGPPSIVTELLKMGSLKALEKCLSSNSQDVRREACWALAFIASSEKQHVSQFYSQQTLLDSLLEILSSDVVCVRVEALRVLVALGESGQELPLEEFYVQAQVVATLADLLKQEQEQEVVVVALQSLFNMLQRATDNDKGELILQQLARCNAYVLLRRLQFSNSKYIIYELNKLLIYYIAQQDLDASVV